MAQVSGLASGLDVNQIVSDYMKAESMPKTKMENEKQLAEWKKEAMEDIFNDVNSLITDVTDLTFTATYTQKSIDMKSDYSDYLSVLAKTSASSGKYDMKIHRLATETKVESEGFMTSAIQPKVNLSSDILSANNQKVDTLGITELGKISLELGDNSAVEIDLSELDSDSTLEDLSNLLNQKITEDENLQYKMEFSVNEKTPGLEFRLWSSDEDLTIKDVGTGSFLGDVFGNSQIDLDSTEFLVESTAGKVGNKDNTTLAQLGISNIQNIELGVTEDTFSTIDLSALSTSSTVSEFITEVNLKIDAIADLNPDGTADSRKIEARFNTQKNTFELYRKDTLENDAVLVAKDTTGDVITNLFGGPAPTAKEVDATKLSEIGFRDDFEEGVITIQGVEINVEEDDTFSDVLDKINNNTDVTAIYDDYEDKIILKSKNPSSSAISIGGTGDTSNFLELTNLLTAEQTKGDGVATSTLVESHRKISVVSTSKKLSDLNFAEDFEAGSFTINDKEFTIKDETTIAELIKTVNDADAGVKASYDSYNDKFIFTSSEYGPKNIKFGRTSDTSNILDLIRVKNADQNLGQTAAFTVKGYNNDNPIYTDTNTISDVIDDVTVDLKLAYDNSTQTNFADDEWLSFEVKADTSNIKDKFTGFIDKYNSTIEKIYNKLHESKDKKATFLTAEEKMSKTYTELTENEINLKKGMLRNDPSLQLAYNKIREIASSLVQNVEGQEYTSLSSVGINTKKWDSSDDAKMGKLYIENENQLDLVISSSTDQLKTLFANNSESTESKGLGVRLKEALNDLTKRGGALYEKVSLNGSIDREIFDIQKNINAFEDRLVLKERMYWDKFTNLEVVLSSLQSQSDWLSQQLSGLSGSSS